MSHALRLAERGLFTTQPNPRVGCVIAHGEDVVGEGFHERAGEPHAEVHALRAAGERARGATAYVTLEPCGLHGRTPPCADALIEAGVVRVVMASEDTSQAVGAGLQRLRDAGIEIASGLMRDAARELNIGFFSRIERGRPFVRVKLAMSLDGRTALADGTSKWITGEAARNDVQRWRARSSAILTGSGTALADDPRLTVRLDDVPHVPPLRVVFDRHLRLAEGTHLLDGGTPTLVLHGASVKPDLRFAGVECLAMQESSSGLDLEAALKLLGGRGVNELHVEAGPTLAGALFAAGLADELLLYVAPVLLGDRARPLLALPPLSDMSRRWGLEVLDRRAIGDDLRLRLRPRV
ncbi:bifunctional diaminohydroxyphosphoribosylaminopyrimidine deaminase/5-amino-6-(5-phosphoribosylamino)uracil reductase RibD [Oleiagrimonas citrea]|uniref:Riboflavin biosynthesis protein RibD n=1 Tax=Oleiagrimonas citrea TaxID=1665687 RepID=A0A846ZKU9_9GAMM|nr:bifunctional diaminohydroxyphosphoribosylaminopyrimidine deaminase/5-amino-6-(5-phosphoribosylamino)uracil reductase RibD [Oleiagrimonas citrea]NKZ38193.1 bifunctional diaminohydroxyphosphoribosylaminopyrimidine deaminase/5-amino-6-(5-phosphoribosylamino)uracil reductase RibD [Oleiagrimonas citrea]